MRTGTITLMFFLASMHLISQTSLSDCEGATVLCGDVYSEDAAPLGTGNFYEFTGSCNQNLEQASAWYTFTVQSDGMLDFTITPNNLNDDYDWGLFNITEGGCAGITALDGSSPEVSCNSWGTLSPPNGATGISTEQGGVSNSSGPGDAFGPPFNADLPVTDGQQYALVIMNWTNSLEGYTIDFGESTASLYDDIPPAPVSLLTDCTNSNYLLSFSEGIIIETVQNADFVLTGPGGAFIMENAAPLTAGASTESQFTLGLPASIAVPGVYTLTFNLATGSVEDACGNTPESTITIELFAPMDFDVTTQTACNGVDGTLEVSNITGGDAPYEFRLGSSLQSDLLVDGLSDGDYVVTITDGNDCSTSQTITVPNNPLTVIIPPQDTLSCSDPFIQITDLVIAPDQFVDYTWLLYTTDGTVPTGSNAPNPTFSAPGLYEVTAVNTGNGCSWTTTFSIESESNSGIDITQMRFPNVFTPNGDSKNEQWGPFLANNPDLELTSLFDVYELYIYNRWGNEVFNSESNSRRWSAKEEAAGIYFYTVKYSTNCGGGASGTKEGFIELIR